MKNWFYPFTIVLFSCICFGCIYHEFNIADKVSKMQHQYAIKTDSIQHELNTLKYAFEQQNQQSRKDTLVVRMNKLVVEHTSKR